jgi:transcriptional regulator with PAS, ATPase and Fis domain
MGDIMQDIQKLIKNCESAWIHGDMKSFKQDANELLEVSIRTKQPFGIAQAYNNLGLFHKRFGNFDKALEYFYQSLEVIRTTDRKQETATTLTNIGMTYGSMGNIDDSLKYYLESLKIFPKACEVYINIGFSYQTKNDFTKAIKYYNQAENLATKQGKKKLLAVTLMHTGTIHAKQGDLDLSDEKLNKSFEIASEVGDEYQIGGIKFQQAMNLIRREKFAEALRKFNDVLKIVQKQENKMAQKSVYDEIAKIHVQNGDFYQAYECKSHYTELSEQIFNQKIAEKISDLQMKYELELKEEELKQKKLESEKKVIAQKLEEFKKAYSDVTGIGQVGIFSAKMREIMKLTEFFHKDRHVSVLIEGETGTGKEIIARMVHYGDDKTKRPFIIVNCSAISPTLFESELFGYEEGAFTGARSKGMVGKFELAQGGTIFLDEIGDLPLELQPKLLRALQQKEIYRIGGTQPIALDVRIIGATNRDLQTEITNGTFRRDLYYRLNTGRIFLPPLRERKEEIGPLAQIFLLEFSQQKSRSFKYITSETVKLLERYVWPGNVRELRNAIERATLLYDDLELKPAHLTFLSQAENGTQGLSNNELLINFPDEGISLAEIERMVMKKGLEICGGNKAKLAQYLNVSQKTIYRRKL